MESLLTKKLINYKLTDKGIAVITWNMPDSAVNVINKESMLQYVNAIQQAIADVEVKGVIITSGKSDFISGGDLNVLLNPNMTKKAFFDWVMEAHYAMRALETSGKPVVAAINGNALGGGCEIALACHYRVMINNLRSRIGLVECSIGLMPGSGGTQRYSRLFGYQKAIEYITQSKQFNPEQAQAVGLVDELADTPTDLIAAAEKWLEANNVKTFQAWDKKGFQIPEGALASRGATEPFTFVNAMLKAKTHGNLPHLENALKAIYNGMPLSIDKALQVEARYFTHTVFSKESRNIIRSTFFHINEAKKGKTKPRGFEKFEINKLGILGAGMMGAGIAYVSAKAGIDVILKDVDIPKAEKGKAYAEKIEQIRLLKKGITNGKSESLVQKIQTTDSFSELQNCDLVIEAVFENTDLKAQVTSATESLLSNKAIFASNTSTIPITHLAKAAKKPENFIGLHFFSPVEKMQLVEVIVGEKTSDYALAGAIDFVTKIRKIPIVVNDSRGFFTSRVFAKFVHEGMAMLSEGIPAGVIENMVKKVGMPVGPLAVTDEVNMKLLLHVLKENPDKMPFELEILQHFQKMVDELGRPGKKEKKGFYDYPEGEKKHLWKGLSKIFPPKSDYKTEEVGKRILHTMALDTYRCLDEGVLRSSKDGDIGSILGFGFPIYTGGAISYIDFIGIKQFIKECDDFANRIGERFHVPDSLRERAEKELLFYP